MIVYIREAHAIDSPRPMGGPLIEDPVTLEERLKVAGRCVADLKLPMLAVVDKIDDKINRAYGAAPDRLYLVGKDGKIAYAGGQGPFDFRPEEFERAVAAEVMKNAPGK